MHALTHTLIVAVVVAVFGPFAPAAAHARCQGLVGGPCNTPEPVSFLPGPAPVLVTNFGLLYPDETTASWQLVCDDLYGLALPAGLRRASDGRVFAGAGEGLRFSSDGCTWDQAGGVAAGRAILDVTVAASGPPGRVWALTELPPALLRSDDGGARFVLVNGFDALGKPSPYHRVVASGDGQRLYLFGRDSNNATPAAVSTDGGQTFTAFDLSMRAAQPPPSPLEFLAIAPGDPQVLYFQAFDPTGGDQLWRSGDGGQTVAAILKLNNFETLGGFSFGATEQVLYAGTVNAFAGPGTPPGTLHVSRDAGASWEPPVPSPATGPRYRCLSHSGGKLYACGAGEILGDAFLVGVSTDEGRSWQPHVRLRDVAGARSCAKSRCLATELWLCELHGQCAADAGAPATDAADASPDAADASPDAARPAGNRSSGCSCALGGHGSTALLPLSLIALLALRKSRWPRARRPPGEIAEREARKA